MPTTFQNMRDAVIAKTKRPELVAVTDSAIRMATLRAHGVDFFPRDLSSFVATYTVPSGLQIFVDIPNIYTSAPLLRTLNYMVGEDAVSLQPVEILEHKNELKDFWDVDSQLLTSVFTQLGENIRARFGNPTGRATVYYYRNPDIAELTYSSWIADMHIDELAQWAAGIVWSRTGFLEQASDTQKQHVMPFKDYLVTSYLSSKV